MTAVAIVGRIEGDGGARGDPLIGADVAKASAGEGRQAFHDIEANDLRPQARPVRGKLPRSRPPMILRMAVPSLSGARG